MQAEIVQLCEIVNQQANGKSGVLDQDLVLVTTEALCVARAVHLALLILTLGAVIIAISVALQNILWSIAQKYTLPLSQKT